MSEDHGWQDYHNGVNIALHPTDDRDDDNNDQYLFILKRMPRMINCRRKRRRGRHCGLTNHYYSHIVDIIPFLMIFGTFEKNDDVL